MHLEKNYKLIDFILSGSNVDTKPGIHIVNHYINKMKSRLTVKRFFGCKKDGMAGIKKGLMQNGLPYNLSVTIVSHRFIVST